MKIILPLNNEQPNENIDLTYIFPIDTLDLDDEFKDRFYCEIGKQLFIAKNNLIKNEDYIGIIQNKRWFLFLDKRYNKEFNYEKEFKNIDIICTQQLNIRESIYSLEFNGNL